MFLTRRCIPELLKRFFLFQAVLGERVKVVGCCHGKPLSIIPTVFSGFVILRLSSLRVVSVKLGRGRGQDQVRPLSFPRFLAGIHVWIFLCVGL